VVAVVDATLVVTMMIPQPGTSTALLGETTAPLASEDNKAATTHMDPQVAEV